MARATCGWEPRSRSGSPGGDRVWEARWRWHADDLEIDVALVEITDSEWLEPNVPAVRWGRLTCQQIEVLCEATGAGEVKD